MGPRLGLDASQDGRALGYVIETPVATVFYSGDTDHFSGFANVGWSFEPDIALLNVNGHLPGTDAARAGWATRAPVVVPIHWGAFGYWVVGGNRRPRDEETLVRVVGDRLRVLEVGQSVALAGGAGR
jgi:L-ascorbate metabolism protein UlaG (beta-lactamase superfamily)